ncbi:MAG: hypothetical protein AAFP90_18085 [Planctomycetota bacterium]
MDAVSDGNVPAQILDRGHIAERHSRSAAMDTAGFNATGQTDTLNTDSLRRHYATSNPAILNIA